jgi:hypothetical protein
MHVIFEVDIECGSVRQADDVRQVAVDAGTIALKHLAGGDGVHEDADEKGAILVELPVGVRAHSVKVE